MPVLDRLDGLLHSAQAELDALMGSRARVDQESALLDAKKRELDRETAQLSQQISAAKRQIENKRNECNQIEKSIAKLKSDLKHSKSACDSVRNKYSQDLNKAYRKHRPRFDPRLPVIDGPSEHPPQYSTSVPELSRAIDELCCMVQPSLRSPVNGIRKTPDLACLQTQIYELVNIFKNYEIVSVDTDCANRLDLAPLEIDQDLWSEIIEQTNSLRLLPPHAPF